MFTALKRRVCEANRQLPGLGLAPLNFGNASAIDRVRGVIAIKPSGVDYASLRAADMVIVDLDGRRIEGRLRPSSDTPTHLELYRGFPGIGGVVHAHSAWATAFAQAGLPIPAFGTTHADYFRGEVPVTRPLRPREIAGEYEAETGRVILETFRDRSSAEVPAALVHRHAPFVWGPDVGKAMETAVALEFCACAAARALRLNPGLGPMATELLDRHFLRKHGRKAYYGQEASQNTQKSARRRT